MKLLTIIVVCCYLLHIECKDIKEDYYQKLIDTEMKNALNYKFPKNNKQFIKGFLSKEVQGNVKLKL